MPKLPHGVYPEPEGGRERRLTYNVRLRFIAGLLAKKSDSEQEEAARHSDWLRMHRPDLYESPRRESYKVVRN